MIDLSDPRRFPGRATETPQQRQRRRGAAEAFNLFGGPARGGLDFNKDSSAPAGAIGPGGGLYPTPAITPELSRRSETARRDALPVEIAALAQRHPGLDLDHLEALASIKREADRTGGGFVTVKRQDVPDAVVSELERHGLIRRVLGSATFQVNI